MEGLKTKEDRRFQTFWVIFFILISVIAIIPVLRVISISFSGRDAINKGQVFIFPISATQKITQQLFFIRQRSHNASLLSQ